MNFKVCYGSSKLSVILCLKILEDFVPYKYKHYLYIRLDMIMGKIVDINKYAVDGDNAERIYEILNASYYVENNFQPLEGFSVEIKFDFADGVLRVEERVMGSRSAMSYIGEILYFFAGSDNVFSMTECIVDDVVQSYFVCDRDGKYFVRPPMTDWELQREEQERQRLIRGTDDDLPF